MLNVLYAWICHARVEFITAKISLLYFTESVESPLLFSETRDKELEKRPEWHSKFCTLVLVEI